MKLSNKDVREFLLNENTIERIYGILQKLEVQPLQMTMKYLWSNNEFTS